MHVLPQPLNDGAARMEPLAKLPIFWGLEKKRVVIAGGTDAAAWKAELMAACGAQVEVFAEEASDGLRTLLTHPLRHPDASLVHNHRLWKPTDLMNAELAIGDFDDDAEADRFFDAARKLGIPVNVIDKPRYCQFQFGSIVNRSPVVVAISTDGAAPILAQAIRRKIETLLPRAMQSWAQSARSLRDTINRLLKTTSERRIFWEKFADDAFKEQPGVDTQAQLLASARDIRVAAPSGGSVTLIGAGPGDAELLTLKAVRALQAADVILFDDLVSAEVLELARREAKRMLVGKRGGRVSCRQEDINEMMVTFAKAGKRVVRLKSGDPTIFGRAGEEIAWLERQDIPVDVIPGITAASAMAAGLGLSLTHRDHAQSVRYITGHSRSGELPADLDWRSIADPRTTNVFYMGGRTAPLIAERLVAAGLSSATPAIVASNVSRPGERRWSGTLAGLANGIEEIGYDQPVLIAIGQAMAARRTTKIDAAFQGNPASAMAAR